jgi:hypothetical protein
MARSSFLRAFVLKVAAPLAEQAGLLVRDLVRQRHERRMAELEADEASADEGEGDTDDATQPDE